jgi:signal transduction histidine kinase
MELGSANGELIVRSSGAPTVTVRARRSPVSGVWLVLEDVSELRRLQRIRAEFIDNLSHELRTPLTTISLLAETAASDAESASPRLRDRISKIEIETGHLTQMVNELLDLSRIEGGSPQLHLDDVDLDPGRPLQLGTIETVCRTAGPADRPGRAGASCRPCAAMKIGSGRC